jgi:hypothetical protein
MARVGSCRRRARNGTLVAILIGVMFIAIASAAVESPFGIDLPASRRADAELTTNRCARCHTLQRVLEADHRGEAWNAVVDRMRSKTRSGVSRTEAKRIAAFLDWWSARRPPPEDATTSADALVPPRFARVVALTLRLDSGPVDMTCGDEVWRVESVTRVRGTTTARVTVHEESFEASLAPGKNGTASRTLGEIRAWSIGRYRLRLVLAVAAVDEDDRVTIGAYVERLPPLRAEAEAGR